LNKKTTYHLSFRFFLILPALLFFLKCSDSESLPDFTSSNTGPYILNIEHLELIRDHLEEPVLQQEYQILISGADDLLNQTFEYVTDKPHPPDGGTLNDYLSIARYWHADSTGAQTIYRDGITNPMIYDYDRPKLARMSSAVYTLSLAYFFSENDIYAEKASELIYSWFLDKSTRMNPNMDFSQIRLGVENTGGGGTQGIIDANDLVPVIEAVSLIYDSNHWPGNYHIQLKNWFYQFSRWIIKNYNADAYNTTNISTWMDVQRATFFLFSEQEYRLNSDFHIPPVTDRINAQFEPDGIQPFEKSRERSQHYVYFNLRGYMNLALIRKNRSGTDRDWPTLNGSNYAGLKGALDNIRMFTFNKNVEPYFIPNPEFDDCRYLEIFMPAAVAFKSSEYAETAELLINNGCSHPDITLTFPPLDWLHNQPDY